MLSDYRRAKSKDSFKVMHYFCNYTNCEFKCLKKENIEKHIKKFHSINKKLWVCLKCGQKFVTHRKHSNHIRQSHKEWFDERTQMFRCDYNECKSQFVLFSQLLGHRKKHSEKLKPSDQFSAFESTFVTNTELNSDKSDANHESNEVIDQNSTDDCLDLSPKRPEVKSKSSINHLFLFN